MAEEGVNGLSLSEVARRLGVKPPSIYKYFDSLMAIYDALFERGQRAHLEAMRTAMEQAPPGLDRARGRPRSRRPLGPAPLGHGAAAVLAPGPQLRTDARSHGPQHRDGTDPTPGIGRRSSVRTVGPRGRLRRSTLGGVRAHQRRPGPGDGQRTRRRLGRGPLQPTATQTPGHTRRPLSLNAPSSTPVAIIPQQITTLKSQPRRGAPDMPRPRRARLRCEVGGVPRTVGWVTPSGTWRAPAVPYLATDDHSRASTPSPGTTPKPASSKGSTRQPSVAES